MVAAKSSTSRCGKGRVEKLSRVEAAASWKGSYLQASSCNAVLLAAEE